MAVLLKARARGAGVKLDLSTMRRICTSRLISF